MNPSDPLALADRTRALARLGRYDEAIASWRAEALAAGDTGLATALATARGREGYRTLKHAEGRKRLAALERGSGRTSPLRLALAGFAAGDVERGFSELETARQAPVPAIYRLTCHPDVDEVRDTPRFAAALERIGSLRVR